LGLVLEERLAQRSVARKLEFVAAALHEQTSRHAIVFVLEHYELFAVRTQQTLLYALYDLAHQQLRTAIIGVSTNFVLLMLVFVSSMFY
jgi:hypothetical protein